MKKVVVLGAGVVGLTTALKIQQTGLYDVQIIAGLFPSDPKNIKYCSQWAGARFVSTEKIGSEQAEIDWATFQEMWKMSEPGGIAEECFLRMTQRHYFTEKLPSYSPLQRMPGFREIPRAELPTGVKATHGVEFQTFTIEPARYLPWLAKKFQQAGGAMVRKHVQHIDEVTKLGPHAVIVCLGLGARFLGGVEDKSVFPSRGQNVILRAPWIRDGSSFIDPHSNPRLGTDVVPRKSGEVLIGGTQEEPKPRPETTREMLRRSLALCPQLVPPDKRSRNPPDVKDILPIVVEEACGHRPVREGGPRIELDSRKATPVIYNYGHGGDGYIKSIGSANIVLKLLASV
ncbi:hypothetical protein D9613_008695 [Agrocybe pediades]|uniref:FAD dependent oxidoreductase domain-containing protein n=1 Tax=Agrocybe pediades TaxID=84607 RepID=A0A8H4VMU4_9AGAR|nr:hypothetical protein D9613_008695 [Agrocybe pediades]